MSKRFNNQSYIVYDSSCPFCTGLAEYFEKSWKIRIVANVDVEDFWLDKEKIKKDVHFVVIKENSVMIYSGAEAAVYILGTNYPILINLNKISVFRICFKSGYWIVKKLRKYLGSFI